MRRTPSPLLLALAVGVAACSGGDESAGLGADAAALVDAAPGVDTPAPDAPAPADGGATIDGAEVPPPPPWTPRPFTATRFVVFYQLTADVLPVYADPTTGLPQGAGHAYVFAHSHASAPASLTLADRIHGARADFLYAPAFDLNEHPGWGAAADAELAAWAHDFRDAALAAHADLFAFNEATSSTPTDANARAQMARLLGHLHDPAPDGTRLRGVFFMTHAPSMPANWTSPASAFWQAVDDTCDAVVAEHYHGQGFTCTSDEAWLSDHLFALRRWLDESGEPAKVSIANRKFTVLHSARYGPGASGWQGADSDVTALAEFQRNLSRLARVTRGTPGGVNRISFAPIANSITDARVHPRIAELARWHYGLAAAAPAELACVAGADGNCRCQ